MSRLRNGFCLLENLLLYSKLYLVIHKKDYFIQFFISTKILIISFFSFQQQLQITNSLYFMTLTAYAMPSSLRHLKIQLTFSFFNSKLIGTTKATLVLTRSELHSFVFVIQCKFLSLVFRTLRCQMGFSTMMDKHPLL